MATTGAERSFPSDRFAATSSSWLRNSPGEDFTGDGLAIEDTEEPDALGLSRSGEPAAQSSGLTGRLPPNSDNHCVSTTNH